MQSLSSWVSLSELSTLEQSATTLDSVTCVVWRTMVWIPEFEGQCQVVNLWDLLVGLEQRPGNICVHA
jgi:hypothetical protein